MTRDQISRALNLTDASKTEIVLQDEDGWEYKIEEVIINFNTNKITLVAQRGGTKLD